MNVTINFLLQVTRILHLGQYTEEDLEMSYNFVTSIDKDVLIHYLNSKTILSYNSDLELYIEIINSLINTYEMSEEYEKCDKLKNKREEAIKILNN